MSQFGEMLGGMAGGALLNEFSRGRDRQYNQDMADYNQRKWQENQEYLKNQQLDLWNKTNASAQRRHLENAGLSFYAVPGVPILPMLIY